MALPALQIDVLTHIPETGDEWAAKGHLPAESYEVGEDSYLLPDGVDFDLVFTNTGGSVLLSGMARARAVGVCARCLEPATIDLSCEVEGFYVADEDAPHGAMSSDDDEPGDEEFEHLPEDGLIDVSVPLAAALVLETPMVPLCREDCRGLCPVCGHNLNEGDCEHVDAQPPLGHNNPFGILKDLHIGE